MNRKAQIKKFVRKNKVTPGSVVKDVGNFLGGKTSSIDRVKFPKGPNMGPSHAPPLVTGRSKRLDKYPH